MPTPPILLFFFSHKHTLCTHSQHHTRTLTHLHRRWEAGRLALPQAQLMMKWGRMRTYVCFFMFAWRVEGGWGQNMGLVCAPAFTCMSTVRTENEMSWNFFLIFSSIFCSWLFPHFLFFFFSCFFPFFRQVPWKRKPSVFCSGSQRGLPNAQLLSSASSPVSRYANFLWWSEGHRDKSAAL